MKININIKCYFHGPSTWSHKITKRQTKMRCRNMNGWVIDRLTSFISDTGIENMGIYGYRLQMLVQLCPILCFNVIS